MNTWYALEQLAAANHTWRIQQATRYRQLAHRTHERHARIWLGVVLAALVNAGSRSRVGRHHSQTSSHTSQFERSFGMKALITLLSLIGMIITFAVPTASLAAPVSPSLYLIGKAGTGSGRLEVHILNGAGFVGLC